MSGPTRLDLGCGARCRPGWIGVDIRPQPGVQVVHDVRLGLPFPDNYADEINASHILEHFSYHDVYEVLPEWIRVLKPGGRIESAVPDVLALAAAYASGKINRLTFVQWMYGAGQGKASIDVDWHKNGLDWGELAGLLRWYGCERVRRLPPQDFQLDEMRPYELHVEAYKAEVRR